jgi:hypothetical protein
MICIQAAVAVVSYPANERIDGLWGLVSGNTLYTPLYLVHVI